jgi:thiosulfate dehydrogenase [quinone] large subunit
VQGAHCATSEHAVSRRDRRANAPPPAGPNAQPAAEASIRDQLRRASPSQLALLPIRMFFGVTFLYAGIDKLLDPTFLDPSSPGSITAQLQAFARVSPLAALVRIAEPWAPAVGILIALAEIAIGLGALTSLAFRAAAAGGAVLSLLFFLTASWTTHPYYYGADLPYTIGWIALLIGGTGGLLVPRVVREIGAVPPDDVRFARGARGVGRPRGAMTEPEVSPGRRLILQAGVLGAFSIAVASVALPLRFLRAGDDAGLRGAVSGDGATAGAGSGVPGGATVPGSTPSASPAPSGSPAVAGSPGAAGSPPGSTFHPSGLTVASTANVDRKGAVAIRVPADAPGPLPAGDPAVIVRLADGSYVCYDAVCTHEGCRVGWDARDSVLLCPCHGAAFDPADHGAVLAGPTNVPLPELPLVVDKVAGTITLKA